MGWSSEVHINVIQRVGWRSEVRDWPMFRIRHYLALERTLEKPVMDQTQRNWSRKLCKTNRYILGHKYYERLLKPSTQRMRDTCIHMYGQSTTHIHAGTHRDRHTNIQYTNTQTCIFKEQRRLICNRRCGAQITVATGADLQLQGLLAMYRISMVARTVQLNQFFRLNSDRCYYPPRPTDDANKFSPSHSTSIAFWTARVADLFASYRMLVTEQNTGWVAV